jgi:predicted dehydrogenase
MTRFRLAIAGSGKIAAQSHLPAAVASQKTEAVALVDPVVERAARLAKLHRLRLHVASELAEVLGEVDGVLIATPNNTHSELVRQCVEAGVPVLVEKPLTSALADAEALVAAAESAGVTVAVGYCTRFQDNVQLMHSLLRSGYFGNVRRFAYQYGVAGGWASESGFHLQREAVGGGLLVTTGTHFLDRLLHWFGYPDEVELQDDSLGGPEANALARFRFRSGASPFEGSARFTKTGSLPGGLVIEVERGTLVLRDAHDAPVLFRPVDRPELEFVIKTQEPPRARTPLDLFRLQIEDFVGACEEGRAPLVPAREGLESVRLVQELYANRSPMHMGWYAEEAR